MSYQTVAITDHKVVTPTVARVVVSFTGNPNKKEAAELIRAKFDNLATPVEGSFRLIKAGVAVGFIRANREVRVVDDREIKAHYRVMSSNIMMDNSDRSLWVMSESRGGKFLARHGDEDLGELINASVMHVGRPDVPALRHLSMASAVKKEFASYVSAATGYLEHGHVLAVSADGSQVQILSSKSRAVEVVSTEMITALSHPPLPKSFKTQMVKAGISTEDKAQAKEYWDKLYSYDPDYLAMVKEQVEETTWI